MVLEKIRQLYPKLTKSQKRVADYVATSYREAAFMTASRLAERVSVNEATVIRFAQALGYPGFPGLSDDIQATVQEELRIPQPTVAQGETEAYLVTLSAQVEGLRRAISHMSAPAASAATRLILDAPRVLVLGQGLAAPLADALCQSLRLLGKLADQVPADPLAMAPAFDLLETDALLIVITLGPESAEQVNAVRLATQRGARTMALTWSAISAVAQVCELAIQCPSDEPLALPSWGAVALFADTLVRSVATREGEALRARAARLAQTRESLTGRRR